LVPVRVEAHPVGRPALETAMDFVLEAIQRGRNPETVRSNLKGLDVFRAFLEVETVKEAVARLVSAGNGQANMTALKFQTWLLEQKKSPSTVNRRLGALKVVVGAFRFAGAITWSLDVPSIQVETYRDTAGPGTERFAEKMAELEKSTDAMALRDRAILILTHDAALRRGEVASIDLEHVDWKAHRVWVKAKKRNQRVDIPISPDIEQALRDWIKVRGEAPGALFKNFDPAQKGDRLTGTSIGRISKARGVGRPHGIRHLAITEACEALGGDIMEAMKFARHKDPKTTMTYMDNLKKRTADVSVKLAEFRKGKRRQT